ncbi:uncharacterized protein LOC116184009 [Lonchura striata]
MEALQRMLSGQRLIPGLRDCVGFLPGAGSPHENEPQRFSSWTRQPRCPAVMRLRCLGCDTSGDLPWWSHQEKQLLRQDSREKRPERGEAAAAELGGGPGAEEDRPNCHQIFRENYTLLKITTSAAIQQPLQEEQLSFQPDCYQHPESSGCGLYH